MASRTIIEKRLAFREKSLERLYDAYTALVEGGVKSTTGSSLDLIFRRCPRKSRRWRTRSIN